MQSSRCHLAIWNVISVHRQPRIRAGHRRRRPGGLSGLGDYDATKWGIEGSCETLAAEVAQFDRRAGSDAHRVEAAKDLAPAKPEYAAGEFGETRRVRGAEDYRGPNDAIALPSTKQLRPET
jgi:hypothetical protein